MGDPPVANSRTDMGPVGRAYGKFYSLWWLSVRRVCRRRGRAAVENLPEAIRPAARWAIDAEPTEEESELIRRLESTRSEIALLGRSEMRSYSSPVPGSFGLDTEGKAKPGPSGVRSARGHATTGSGASKGIMLRRLVDGGKAARVLELGSHIGMSGSYIASSPRCEVLVTVEGSVELAGIAESVIARFSEGVNVRCMMFDEALDALATEAPFDLAFLDGQHEGEALHHYTHRLVDLMAPGGMIVLDDIYWSRGMNQAWQRLVAEGVFSASVDLGALGVGILDGTWQGHWEFAKFSGRPRIPRRIGD